MTHTSSTAAPRGGDATVHGNCSHARGGDAGPSAKGQGGRGGDASVIGDHSTANGGSGGRGGIGPGGPGGDVQVHGDNIHSHGGQGGEAPQHDGRGGRGGRAGLPDNLSAELGTKFRPRHMRWPYGEPITEFGRGGDSPDTPQYKARRIIVEEIKAVFFAERGLPPDEVWWDRDVVSIEWINRELAAAGHEWTAVIVDDEYEFSDLP